MTDLTLKDILIKSSDYLKKKKVENSRLETELIISHFLQINRMDIYLQFERVLTDNEASKLRNAITERGKRKPLQYIIGQVEFLDIVLKIDENVLIPRPETEFMTDLILKSEPKCHSILDLCTGSGAIAIAIKKRWQESKLTATDISQNALDIAKQNATFNHVEIDFVLSDIFEKINNRFDLIISNPPYISQDDYQKLEPELFFEPKNSLVADENGGFFYKTIIQQAKNYLNPQGKIYLEIGSEQAELITKLVGENSYSDVTIIKDLAGFDRIAIIK